VSNLQRKVEFLTNSGQIVVDLTPELGKRLMEMLQGATSGWLLIGPEDDPNPYAIQVSQIITWKIIDGGNHE
jgi:hypothetical protein